jgi:SnoaL-like domain
MTWHTEFGHILYESAQLRGVAPTSGWLDAVKEMLLAGDPEDLLEAFPDGVRIDDPRAGRIEGRGALQAYCESSASWIAERHGVLSTIASTVGPSRVVGEFELALTEGTLTFGLPMAVVVEPSPAARSVWIRIYHSQWPLLGHHVVRPPLLARDPSVVESDVVGEYQRALAAGDAEAIVATFESDGCFREPAGPQFRVCGTPDLSQFFNRFFSAGGGIILEHCTVAEDGVRTALEFNAVRWGGVDLPPQAGVAVYERGRSGKLAEARIYDDVEGPVE